MKRERGSWRGRERGRSRKRQGREEEEKQKGKKGNSTGEREGKEEDRGRREGRKGEWAWQTGKKGWKEWEEGERSSLLQRCFQEIILECTSGVEAEFQGLFQECLEGARVSKGTVPDYSQGQFQDACIGEWLLRKASGIYARKWLKIDIWF